MSSGFGIVLLGVGLVAAFLIGDVVPGMTLAGWIMAFTGMIAITRGDRPQPGREHDPG